MSDPQRVGRYEIVERVGRGGMGVLYRARDTVLDRDVAIKIMSSDFSSDETARPRFYREARAAARLQHRNIVTIFEFAEEQGTPYIAMEFLRGSSLSSRIRAQPRLSLTQVLDIGIELCVGLQFAHDQGVVHRDVKPANIWVQEDGTIKLLDFGIARLASGTATGNDLAGSAAYMAPEQISGKPVDGRADVFSAGVMLYELVGGRKPFDGDSPTAVLMKIVQEDPPPLEKLAPATPAPLLRAIRRALDKNPDRRYASAADLAADLRVARAALTPLEETLAAPGVRAATGRGAGGTNRRIDQIRDRIGNRIGAVLRAHRLAAGAIIVAVAVTGLVGWRWVQRQPPKNTETAPPPNHLIAPPRATEPAKPAEHTVPAGNAGRADRPAPPPAEVEAIPVTFTASGPYPFEVLDGTKVISRAADHHRLTVTSPKVLHLRAEDEWLDIPVRVPANAARRVDAHAPAPGRLTVRASPETCKVIVGGFEAGYPPIVNHPIAAGTYQVSLACPDGRPRRTKVTVAAGESQVAIVR